MSNFHQEQVKGWIDKQVEPSEYEELINDKLVTCAGLKHELEQLGPYGTFVITNGSRAGVWRRVTRLNKEPYFICEGDSEGYCAAVGVPNTFPYYFLDEFIRRADAKRDKLAFEIRHLEREIKTMNEHAQSFRYMNSLLKFT